MVKPKKSVVSAMLDPVLPEERPFLCPSNWAWARLIQIFYFIDYRGKTPKKTESGIPLVTAKNIRKGYLDYSISEYISEEEYLERQTRGVSHRGDLLFTTEAPLGNVAIADLDVFSAGQRVITLQKHKQTEWVNSKFYYYYILSDAFQQYLQSQKTGSTVAGIKAERLMRFPIPVPPLPEQHRIVARIESLFAKLDEAKEAAQVVLDGCEDRKAAILHKAFTGELTKEWREKHNHSFEEWVTKPWGDFLTKIEAGKNWNAEGRPPVDGEFGVVKVSAVTWGEFNEEESKTCVLEEQWNENVQIKEGDYLFSRANTLQLVGNCVIVKDIRKRLMLSDKILRFRFDDTVLQEYVLHFTRSMIYRHQIEELASGNQDGMRNVSQKNVRLIIFPIPSFDEQEAIVKILNSSFDNEALAKDSAESVLDQIDTMKKAILARAFRGELGTNDPGDESAVELVKRMIM